MSQIIIQGSILVPVLYAIFVSPPLDVTDLSNFADDNFALIWRNDKEMASTSMSNKILTISK